MSFVIDASAAVALHFADECVPFAAMEEALESGEEAFTAPNFFQEVMEALRKSIREGRTTRQDAAAWLTVLDSYKIIAIPINPCASSPTWFIAEELNISPYDAGYLAIAKSRGLPIFSRDDVILKRAAKLGVMAKSGGR